MATAAGSVTVLVHCVGAEDTVVARVNPSANVKQLEALAAAEFGVSAEKLVVYYSGQELDDTSALQSFGIGECATFATAY